MFQIKLSNTVLKVVSAFDSSIAQTNVKILTQPISFFDTCIGVCIFW